MAEIIDPSIADDHELAEELVKAAGHFSRKQILEYFKDHPPSPRVIYLLMVKAQESVTGKASSSGGKGKAAKIAAQKKEPIEKLREVWATGKYTTRDICAEQEYSELGFKSLGIARDALTRTPDPSPWPAKNI